MYRLLLRMIVFLAISAIALELFFRFVLPAREYPRGFHDPETGILKADTSWVTEGVGSYGPYCRPMGYWRINNAGWNSEFDYLPRSDYSRPRIAILGNSYIEAWAADVDSHLDAELFRLLGAEADVYSFGVSGATFAQYLGMIPYIEEEFDPDLYLIMLSSFGISRSLDSSISPFRFYLEEADTGFVLHEPQQIYVQNRFGRVIFRSALARYLYLNKQVGSKKLDVDAEEMVLDSNVDESIPEEYFEAGRFFLGSFEEALPGHRIIFFADGNREAVYENLTDYQQSMDYRVMAPLVTQESMFSLVDLTEYMRDDFAENGIRFSRDYDPHWNNYAHTVAAEALLPYVVEALQELGF